MCRHLQHRPHIWMIDPNGILDLVDLLAMRLGKYRNQLWAMVCSSWWHCRCRLGQMTFYLQKIPTNCDKLSVNRTNTNTWEYKSKRPLTPTTSKAILLIGHKSGRWQTNLENKSSRINTLWTRHWICALSKLSNTVEMCRSIWNGSSSSTIAYQESEGQESLSNESFVIVCCWSSKQANKFILTISLANERTL